SACTSDSQCPAGEACVAGVCTPSTCSGVLCGGQCVDTQSDPSNCGACGSVCLPRDTCVLGGCTSSSACTSDSPCPPGHASVAAAGTPSTCSGVLCGGHCVDAERAPSTGGAWGASCLPGDGCVAGACMPSKCTGTLCGSQCVDLQSDASNCGACGVSCLPGDV